MNITIRVKKEEFDKEGWLKALKDKVEEEALKAGKAFAEAALQRIPVRTGFVAGAFGTLANLVGANARFNAIVSSVATVAPQYYYSLTAGRVLKTPTSGQPYATPIDQMFKWVANNYIFKFEIDITYFRINDEYAGRAPTAPWGAFDASRAAYIDYLQKNLQDNLPKVGQFVRKVSLS